LVSLLTQTDELCSIEISTSGIAVACTSNQDNPKVTLCSFHPCQQSNDKIKQCLMDIVLQNNLKKMRCCWVLHPDQYRLIIVNTPNVPKIEYKNAIRWQIKGIINYPLEDTSVEVFGPNESERNAKKIYAVAAQSSFLQNIVNIIQECNLQSVAVDIREFAIRNLITKLDIENEPVGFLDIVNESCLLVIAHQKYIRFTRRVPFGFKELKTGNYDELTNELQRSFNYCLTELKQKIPVNFFIAPSVDINANIAQNLAEHLDKKVSILNLQKILPFNVPINLETETRCWAVVGGALRK